SARNAASAALVYSSAASHNSASLGAPSSPPPRPNFFLTSLNREELVKSLSFSVASSANAVTAASISSHEPAPASSGARSTDLSAMREQSSQRAASRSPISTASIAS